MSRVFGGVLIAVAFYAALYAAWRFARPSPRLLDNRDLAFGSAAEEVTGPPTAGARTPWVVVGDGLVTGRTGLWSRTWRSVAIADVTLVAVTPPSEGRELLAMRDWAAKGPYLTLRSSSGRVLAVDVKSWNAQTRSALLHELAPTTQLSNVARSFLASGRVPGVWGRPWQVFGFRFGPARRSEQPPTPQPRNGASPWDVPG